MNYSPSEVFARLAASGVKVDSEPDRLAQKCHDAKMKRTCVHKPEKVDVLPEINGKGRPLTEIPKQYLKDVVSFVGYVADTAKREFCIKMKNTVTGAFLTKFKPYVHRWTSIYKKGILAKMYQLEAYTGNEIEDVEFITLTTYQSGTNRESALCKLKEGRKKLLDLLRWRFGTIDYVWVFEPHQSGFSHLHLVYFKKLSESERVSLKTLWHEKYELGDYEHGLSFSDPRASIDGVCVGGSIRSIRNYFMKYVSKGLYSDSSNEYNFLGHKLPFSMSLGELLFNSLLKKTKTRLWGASRHFSEIMKRPEKEKSEEWECFEVDQCYGNLRDEETFYPDETLEQRKKRFFSVLWTKDSGLRPKMVKVWKWFNTVPTWIADYSKREYALKGIKFEDCSDGFTRFYEPVMVPVEVV